MPSTLVIVGRPNVGKSTLFNRLSRSRNALVDDRPGVTRDRLHSTVAFDGVPFTLVDTGGFDDIGQDSLLEKVKHQVARAVEEADVILFIVDGRQGVLPGDEEIAALLRRSKKTVFLAANKIDGPEHDNLAWDFYRLGVETVYPLSAAHGYGLSALMKAVVKELPDTPAELRTSDEIRVAVLGRPNAGKSSLINRILGFERLVVSEMPGTTRDAVDTAFSYRNANYSLIDTAGIRRKTRVKDKVEKFSMIKAIRAIDRCHVALLLLDAARGVSEQDARICGYAFERGRGMVLLLNKWDLMKGDPDGKATLKREIERQLKFISFAPKMNISALTGHRVMKVFDAIDLVFEQFSQRIGTPAVNKAIQAIIERHPPPVVGRKRLRFLYATQVRVRPPTFVVFVDKPDMIHFSYERFLVNQIREHFQLNATPIRLIFRKREMSRRRKGEGKRKGDRT